MDFALLCNDPGSDPLVEVLAARTIGHRLTHIVRTARPTPAVQRRELFADLIDDWHELLDGDRVDAVIVGGDDPEILVGAKQLAAAGIPLLFLPSASMGSTLIYELSLVRDDNQVLLYPAQWHRFDHAVMHLAALLESGQLGQLQLLQFQRWLITRTADNSLAESEIDANLLPDADLLRWLVGDYDQVTALRTMSPGQQILQQTVALAGRGLPQANWVIEPVSAAAERRLTVRGDQASAVLVFDAAEDCWSCEFESSERVKGFPADTAQALLADFAAQLDQQRTVSNKLQPVGSDWDDLVKCYETVDATHRSIKRRRTIELHFEPMSERAIFKTQMTAVGCGLLLLTPFLVLCYLLIATIVPLPRNLLIAFRAVVFAPLVIFLIAQVLLPLTRASSGERSSRASSNGA